jgi:hypothetical protein
VTLCHSNLVILGRHSLPHFVSATKMDLGGKAFRPQPMGLCLDGHPRKPRSVLIPGVRAWQNLYGSTSAASSLALRSSFHRQGRS